MSNKRIGVLAHIRWNSHQWSDRATKEDIENTKNAALRKKNILPEDMNFNHQVYEEPDEKFIGFTPAFNRLPAYSTRKDIEIVFFNSKDYKTNKNYIVGYYAFPKIGEFEREENEDISEEYNFGNIKSKVENIVLFNSPIEFDEEIITKKRYIPRTSRFKKRGVNYLYFRNVMRILDDADELNPKQKKIHRLKYDFLTKVKPKLV